MNFNTYQSCSPVLATSNVLETAKFYEKILGFELDQQFSSDTWAMIWADQCQLFLKLDSNLSKQANGQLIQFCFPAIDEIYERHKTNGANIIQKLTDQPYGLRDYIVEDPNGYHLWFQAHIEAHYKPWLNSKKENEKS